MSLVGDRQAIATALSGVDGVTGYPYRPSTPNTGSAWPLLGALERSEGHVFVATWRVMVLLPPDEQAASVWIDEHHEELSDALMPVGFVDRMDPILLSASGNDQFALQITMRGE